jgi:DNA-binding transcriptional regulator YhcF (GntR family)
MNETWIKTFRKLADHDIITDPEAFRLFMFILLKADKITGELTTGRFLLAGSLKGNPNTIYKALKRLEKKYQVVTQSGNNRFTTIRVLNWAKYQAKGEPVTQSGNNKVTTEQQLGNTYTRIKNKEYKNTKEREYLSKLPEEDVQEFINSFNCNKTQVIEKAQAVDDYCSFTGKKYKDYKAVVRTWLRKDFGIRIQKVQFIPDEVAPPISDEQRQRNIDRYAQMKREKLSQF